MEILIFVFIFSNLNLVFAKDNVAIDNTIAPKTNQNTHTVKESNDFLNDQVAESSQAITKTYGNTVISESLKETHEDTQHREQLPQELAKQLPNGLRSDSITLNPIQVVQSSLQKGYVQPQQTHQLYLQYPVQQVQIFGAEASPLQQTHYSENPEALGYSSYVEHFSEKDEDELKLALKDGSLSDIKRLVPKSGISFKIYPSEKNPEKQNFPAQSNGLSHYSLKNPEELSVLHHRIRGEVPAAPLGQTEIYPTLEELQQGEQQRGSEYSQQLPQSQGQDQQGLNANTVYYTQPGTDKTLSEVNEKSSSTAKPNFKISVAESNYNKQATAAKLHRNLKSSGKSSNQNSSASTSHKYWTLNGQTAGFPKVVKPVKTSEALHYTVDPLQVEGSNGLSYAQNHGGSAVGHVFSNYKAGNSFVETAKHDRGSYPSDSYVSKTSQKNFIGQFANAAHSNQKVVLNYLSEEAEGAKPEHVFGHLATTAYPDAAFKSSRFAATDSETAKSGQHSLITSIPYVETKNSHNFDHQKALEGSTPFDIKNAIDSTGTLIHQTNYPSPTTADIHPLENLQEKPLTYIIPKIPTSTVVIDNSIHDAVVEGHPVKDLGNAGLRTPPQISYHTPVEVAGKFYAPQTFLWTSDYIKQGNALTSKDLHQQLLRLHLPKEEVYVKPPNVEFPVSVVSQVSLPQQKQPVAFHFPFIKSFPQEFHFHPKTKTRVQSIPLNHFAPGQSVTIDWSLFKSGSPNFGIGPLGVKPELMPHLQESGKKKIVPILVRKRKNRSNSKQEIGVVYGKVNANRRPKKPNHRQEKNIRGNLLPEASNSVNQLETKEERKKEFSVSASYKVDRSSTSS